MTASGTEDVPVPKRKSDPKKWKKNMLKQKWLSGEPYVNAAGIAKPGQRTGEDSKCRRKCMLDLCQASKDILMTQFNEMGSKNAQDSYLAGLISVSIPARQRHWLDEARKPHSVVFHYQDKMDVIKVECDPDIATHAVSSDGETVKQNVKEEPQEVPVRNFSQEREHNTDETEGSPHASIETCLTSSSDKDEPCEVNEDSLGEPTKGTDEEDTKIQPLYFVAIKEEVNDEDANDEEVPEDHDICLDSDTLTQGDKDNEEKPHKCKVCGKRYRKLLYLKEHMRVHTGERPFKCDVCKKEFTQCSLLKTHMRVHTGEKPFKCEVCNARFAQRSNLWKHSRTHSGVKPYKCDVCGKEFAGNWQLKYHSRIHSGVKPYKCEICNKQFSHGSNLSRHSSIHRTVSLQHFASYGEVVTSGSITAQHGGGNLCRICGGSTKITSEAGLKTSTCTKCGDVTKHAGDKANENIDKFCENKIHVCGVCGNTYKNARHLREHSRIHKGPRPFKCDVCGKEFYQSGSLKTHLRVHTGEKPYKCDVCGRQFAQSGQLACHARTHTGEKPYECVVCNRQFAQKAQLRSHYRTHTGERPYECDVCGKRFTLPGVLKFHMRIHTGEKPYKCEVCNKDFTTSCALKTHMRIHSKEKPYKCEVCGKQFAQRAQLVCHSRTHTG